MLATLAPMLASVAIWLVTGSAFALIFAALGPITALASLLDARFGAGRITRGELVRFHRDVDAVRREIEAHHSDAKARDRARYPSGADLADQQGGDPHRWTLEGDGAILVNLGAGSTTSAIVLDTPATASVQGVDVAARLHELRQLARTTTKAPLLLDARLGIGISGPPAIAQSLARSLLLQLARSLNPRDFAFSVSAPESELRWIDALPHRGVPAVSAGAIFAQFTRIEDDRVVATIASVREVGSLPGACRVAVRIDCVRGATIVQHPDPAVCGPMELAIVSRHQAALWAQAATQLASRDGLVAVAARLPGRIELGELAAAAPGVRAAPLLSAEFMVDETGSVGVDLVRDGPHAVVGGATGSGKSELLISWVVSLASSHSPDAVNFLLVDFKGGAAFSALESLPHTVGIITDLDESEATRALESLRAELRHRERALAAAHARDISEVASLPRLVIVIDEFATVIEQHAELHSLFSDIAARGRSLGVHLILCTQRPGAAVRDAVLANADLRISLRVNNRADSVAVVGSDDAASLDPATKGRAILARAGEGPSQVQVAVASVSDIAGIADRWREAASQRRPWCEPLPKMLTEAELALAGAEAIPPPVPDAVQFGLLDQPHRQRRAIAVYSPRDDGNLLVTGGPGAGKSTLLRVLSGFDGARPLPRRADAAWDAVEALVRQLDAGQSAERRDGSGELVLIDDIDSLLMRFSLDHRTEFVSRLSRVLRDGARCDLAVAMTARRISSEVQPLAVLVAKCLPLAPANRQELAMLGTDAGQFIAGLPPGGGIWNGDRVQVLNSTPAAEVDQPAREAALEAGRALAVVSGNFAATSERLRAIGCSVVSLGTADGDLRDVAVSSGARWAAIVGDSDDWQSRWGALARLRPVADVLFQHCSLSEFRALTRARELPPPLGDEAALCWRWRADGGVERVRLAGRPGEHRPER